MFTQFFGSYLLSQKLVSREQLANAMSRLSSVRAKLGVLAINAGYMSAEQVERVHNAQAQMDRRFGDIAVEMGFLTEDKVGELLSSQKPKYLLLGQALVDSGAMTNSGFETALASYKKSTKISDDSFASEDSGTVNSTITAFYGLSNSKNSGYFSAYISLLFKNIIRFIGDDFSVLTASPVSDFYIKYGAVQKINGDDKHKLFTAVYTDESAMITFASRYAQECFTENDEYVKASISEFLNLNNGLFTVNISNEHGVELELEPQEYTESKSLDGFNKAYVIPLAFPFGTVSFVVSGEFPT